MHANRVLLPIMLAAAVLAGGCGSDGDGSASDCPPAGTEPRTTTAQGTDPAYLTGLEVEPGSCGDRVVFEFRDRIPGARVQYLPREQALVEDGSGNELEARGEAFLVVRSYLATTRKHGVNPLAALRQLFEGHPWLPASAPP